MNNVQMKHLFHIAQYLNELLGKPLLEQDVLGNVNIGHYKINKGCRYELRQVFSIGGAMDVILYGDSKKELYNKIDALIKGYLLAKES